jgi:hypothetical protein
VQPRFPEGLDSQKQCSDELTSRSTCVLCSSSYTGTQLLAVHVCTTLSDPNTQLCVSRYYFSSGNNHNTVYLALHERIVISAQKPAIVIDFFRGISPYIEANSGILTHISPRLFPSTYCPSHYLLNTITFEPRPKLVTAP